MLQHTCFLWASFDFSCCFSSSSYTLIPLATKFLELKEHFLSWILLQHHHFDPYRCHFVSLKRCIKTVPLCLSPCVALRVVFIFLPGQEECVELPLSIWLSCHQVRDSSGRGVTSGPFLIHLEEELCLHPRATVFLNLLF